MSVDLRAAASDYLRDRRARGYVLADEDWLLANFLEGLATRGETTITVAAALAFATERPDTRHWQARKLRAVRGLAAHVHAVEPAAAQLVPAGLIASKTPRRTPYLYCEEQIVALMHAARGIAPAMFGASMHTLIGLLAATGIRSGEAGALDVCDLDADRRVLRVTGKNRRVRELPLHPTTVRALLGYLEVRAKLAPPTGPLLIGAKGGRLNLTSAREAFRALVNDCRLPVPPGCRAPRMHDARHTFAVNALIDAHRQGVDVDARIATLAQLSRPRRSDAHLLVSDRQPAADADRPRTDGRPPEDRAMSALAPTLQSWFTSYLIGQRGAGEHTIRAYRDTMRLLLGYTHERTGIQPSDLDLSVLDAELIADFLTMLEQAAATPSARAMRGWPRSTRSTGTPRCATPSTPT